MFTRSAQRGCRENAQVTKWIKPQPIRLQSNIAGEILFGDGALDGNHDGEEKNDDLDEDDRAVRSPDADDTNIVTPGNFDSHMAAQTSHSNIPVQRLVQSIRQVTRILNDLGTYSI